MPNEKRPWKLLEHTGEALGQECLAYLLVLVFGLIGLGAVIWMATR